MKRKGGAPLFSDPLSGYRGWGRIKEFVFRMYTAPRLIYQRARYGFSYRDIWSIDSWFIHLMPAMLEQLRDTRHGSPGYLGENYTDTDGFLRNDSCHKEWTEILNRMIFLLQEMDEETCSRENTFEEAWHAAFQEFERKYGLFGEKLISEEDRKKDSERGVRRMFLPSDVPEYKEISEKYMKERERIEAYRDHCKEGFFQLFSRHFRALWD